MMQEKNLILWKIFPETMFFFLPRPGRILSFIDFLFSCYTSSRILHAAWITRQQSRPPCGTAVPCQPKVVDEVDTVTRCVTQLQNMKYQRRRTHWPSLFSLVYLLSVDKQAWNFYFIPVQRKIRVQNLHFRFSTCEQTPRSPSAAARVEFLNDGEDVLLCRTYRSVWCRNRETMLRW